MAFFEVLTVSRLADAIMGAIREEIGIVRKVVNTILACCAEVAVFGGSMTTAMADNHYAPATYSAQRSNSVRLIWRRSMGHHALYAFKGSRYSKHLGIDYGSNSLTNRVKWITNAHELLYDKQTGKELLYYHVNSANGKRGGWIWHGYFRAKPVLGETHAQWVAEEKAQAKREAALSPANTTIAKMNWAPIQKLDSNLNTDNQKLLELFPAATFDYRLQNAVEQDQILAKDTRNGDISQANWQTYFQTLVPVQQSRFVDHILVKNPDSQTSMDQALAAAGLNATARNQYKGWEIGASIVTPTEDIEGEAPGSVMIYLVKE
ncbi:hypothetical protein [Levilactobacillus spicheri]|uniref:Uncharacterized protein n=2 Tax=Levilactobacillus spicheri TaxID=216463 RepID=A0A0R1QU25_9LACO|nr:hypothetical protein [Levilactobacillus spicheri]KRL48055.1 hypothetical protein FD37_GL001613 [Levilactobacillus spicheri DSM 15429]